jgi:hypothetical protein
LPTNPARSERGMDANGAGKPSEILRDQLILEISPQGGGVDALALQSGSDRTNGRPGDVAGVAAES